MFPSAAKEAHINGAVSEFPPISWTKFYNIVDGKHRGSEIFYHGINPSNEEVLWDAPVATPKDLDDAVNAGKRAFETWSKTTLAERRKCLEGLGLLMEEYKEDLMQLIMKETGKSRTITECELVLAMAQLKCNLELEIPEEVLQDDKTGLVVRRYFPIGVVGALCPWNLPVGVMGIKIFQALIAGNVVIGKNSPYSPYAALKFCELAQKVFPPGVFQILGGNDDLGPWFVQHPGIPMISFSGNTSTGKLVQKMAAQNLKRLTLLLAGNDPVVVCPDVENIPRIALDVARATWFISGQACIAIKRIYVHEDIIDEFLEEFITATNNMIVDSPDNRDAFIGAIQNATLFRRLKGLEQDCETNGYTLVLDGKNRDSANDPSATGKKKGYFFYPTIVLDPPSDSRIVREEQFGPIVPLMRWKNLEDVIEEANRVDFGLGATVYCKGDDRAVELGKRIRSGMIWVNCPPRALGPEPYGGIKHSGFGTEGGESGLKCFLNPQTMFLFKD